MLAAGAPFLLLDRTDAPGSVWLYRDPVATLTAATLAEVPALLESLRAAAGLHAAGWLAYEAGLALEPALARSEMGKAADTAGPLGWFGLFEGREALDVAALDRLLGDPARAYLGRLRARIDRAAYARAFARVQDYIMAGDIYQANLSFRLDAAFDGDPLALYAALRRRSAAPYGALIFDGAHWLLSLSPELFFALDGRHVTARPMKGTARRAADPDADTAAAAALARDPKQRAENLMIVDLLRNDLARVAEPGSVKVPALFEVTAYPTVHQMTSTVTATLAPGRDAIDVIRAAFPCGSITGAPRIRAMEVIAEVEAGGRGVYCGAIGAIAPDGSALFNVAIRTLSLFPGENRASLGLGSGLVADSRVADEWDECLAKGEFARMGDRFDLIETMRFEPDGGILRLKLHLERMGESARALGFSFDRHRVTNMLHAAAFHLERPARIRLLLAPSGAMAVETGPLPRPAALWQVALLQLPVTVGDVRLQHKCTDRAFYDEARRAVPEADEVLFHDAQGYLTEGSISSVFVRNRAGTLATPPARRGLIPGVLRRALIASGDAVEHDLTADDLANGFFCGNSLRGLVAAKLIARSAPLP